MRYQIRTDRHLTLVLRLSRAAAFSLPAQDTAVLETVRVVGEGLSSKIVSDPEGRQSSVLDMSNSSTMYTFAPRIRLDLDLLHGRDVFAFVQGPRCCEGNPMAICK